MSEYAGDPRDRRWDQTEAQILVGRVCDYYSLPSFVVAVVAPTAEVRSAINSLGADRDVVAVVCEVEANKWFLLYLALNTYLVQHGAIHKQKRGRARVFHGAVMVDLIKRLHTDLATEQA